MISYIKYFKINEIKATAFYFENCIINQYFKHQIKKKCNQAVKLVQMNYLCSTFSLNECE